MYGKRLFLKQQELGIAYDVAFTMQHLEPLWLTKEERQRHILGSYSY